MEINSQEKTVWRYKQQRQNFASRIKLISVSPDKL